MSRKTIILIAVMAGLISFAGAFGLAFLKRKATVTLQAGAAAVTEEATTTAGGAAIRPMSSVRTASGSMSFDEDAGNIENGLTADAKSILQIKEKRLNGLVAEVREKVRQYETKIEQVDVREQRLKRTHELVKNDLEQLNKMRIELSTIVATLKNEREKLLQSRIEISRTETANLASIAATYDRMDPVSASKILTSMSKAKGADGQTGSDDVVKILHHMSERTKAKLLAQMVETEPKLAAFLCQQMKKVVEKQ